MTPHPSFRSGKAKSEKKETNQNTKIKAQTEKLSNRGIALWTLPCPAPPYYGNRKIREINAVPNSRNLQTNLLFPICHDRKISLEMETQKRDSNSPPPEQPILQRCQFHADSSPYRCSYRFLKCSFAYCSQAFAGFPIFWPITFHLFVSYSLMASRSAIDSSSANSA